MKRQFIIAANWKMNKTVSECSIFVEKFNNLLLDIPESKVIFCPPFSALFYMNGLLGDSPYSLGAQHLHWEEAGAFTGETSAQMLTDCGVTFVIIGHSERRQLFNETDSMVNQRIHTAMSNELTPIVCIGETIEQRRGNKTLSVLESQLTIGLAGLSNDEMKKLIIAYEPVWAIGTGERAEPGMITEAHGSIKQVCAELGVDNVDEMSILYGGSVNRNNVKELLEINNVNGFLIGGASLDAEEFVSIIQQTENRLKE